MTTYHICSACRRSILGRLRNNGIRQWHSKQSFVSLSGIRTATDEVSGYGLPNELSSENTSSHQKGPTRSRASRADRLESLFEEARSSPSANSSPRRSTMGPGNKQLWTDIETLKELVESKTETVGTAWEFFVSNLGSNAWARDETHIDPPAHLRVIAGQLLMALRKARQQSQDLTGLPTVTEILTMYASLGMHSQAQWNHLVFDLLRKLSKHIRGASRGQRITLSEHQDPKTSQHITRIAADLLTAWKFLGHRYCSAPGSSRRIEDLDWSFLPQDLPSELVKRRSQKGWLEDAFLFIFPYLPKRNSKSMASAALTTFALLTDRSAGDIHFEWCKTPLVQLIGKLLQHIRKGVPVREVKGLIEYQVAANAVQDIKIDWLYILNEVDRIARPSAELNDSVFRPSELNFEALKKDLGQALAKRNVLWINRLWGRVKSYSEIGGSLSEHQQKPSSALAIDTSGPGKPIRLPQELYDYFVYAYMGLRKPALAIEVWNHMIKNSIQPSQSTWTAMLGGCKMAKAPAALESVWNKLIASGAQPNIFCWTTRISGLFECGMIKLGMQALNEMGQVWAEAAGQQNGDSVYNAGDIGKIVKPTAATINAAISSLLKRGMNDDAHKVLSWGATIGIPPDMVTFNVLFQAFVRQGHTQEIPALLLQMQKQGLQADFVTFKPLIELVLVDKRDSRTPAEQIGLVNDILKTMKAAGLQPNCEIYCKIIVVLLASSPSDVTAVNAVLGQMADHNFQPTPQIYTMLVTRYFNCSPPDLPAVHLLLDRIKLSGADTTMDHTFWDRVIEGLARANDTTSAVQILSHVDMLPRKVEVGWRALEMLVQALVGNGEWELARKVVSNVRQQRVVEPGSRNWGQNGQQMFWGAMRLLGLHVPDRSEGSYEEEV